MKKVFGERNERISYETRKGVYAVIYNSQKDEVMTVRNERGHHLLAGGGIENGGSHFRCLEREMLEETGYKVLLHRMDRYTKGE
ncbi:NUDIX domain-containing protein [Bacillus suaedae]|uniref:NUDIX domain-containing protein n=1 Tax=Halalkalibacter suaedae TaxID=2822140 RepID=UPI001FF0B82F|nr:NUDIX domain-containing protein [Bacillus suaedae]